MWQTDSTWVVGALRSAQRLAAEDAERNARLAAALRRQQAASVDDRGERRCRECHQQIAHTVEGDRCRRCSTPVVCACGGTKPSRGASSCMKCVKRAYRERHRAELAAKQAAYKRAKRVERARAKLAAKGINL